jgi:dolichyl-diphosphooligosaccharide--protein glycosyltransferase
MPALKPYEREDKTGAISIITAIWVVACVVLAFALRTIPARNFIGRGGELLFYGPDSYDHLRRIMLGVAQFPKVPVFDSYYGYPAGTGLIWSPFFDYLLSLVTILLGGGATAAQRVGFWSSPLFGALTVVVVFFATSRLFGRFAALVATAVLAMLPGHILYTFVSELDHHAIEPLLSLSIVISLAAWQKNKPDEAVIVPRWLLSAFCFVGAILLWRGSVIFWGTALAAIVIQVIVVRKTDSVMAEVLARGGVRLSLAAAAMVTPFCLIFKEATGGGVKFGVVSWFHVILLVCFAAIFGSFSWLQRGLRNARFLITGSAIAIVIAVVFVGPVFFKQFLSGLTVISRGDPWLDGISELRSMLFPGGKFEVSHSLETLSLLYWLCPLLLFQAFRSWRKEGFANLTYPVFIVWGAALWLLPLFRERYVHLAALPVALFCGYGAVLISDVLAERFSVNVSKGLAAMLIAAMLLPVSPFIYRLPTVALPDYERYDLMATMAYLRNNTPKTSFFNNPNRTPEYGVLSDWGLGAYIDYLGQRPTVATNFGWETHGLYESATFLTLADTEQADKILQDNNVRYLLLNNVTGSLPDLRSIAEYGAVRYSRPLLTKFVPLLSMYYRLYIQDGAAFEVEATMAEALGRYRLVYESRGRASEAVKGYVSHYKIFERVAGALIAGTGTPGSRVNLELPLQVGSGRNFVYRDTAIVDKAGKFNIRVPYPSIGPVGDVLPQGPYILESTGRKTRLIISPNAVSQGEVIKVTL